MTFGAGAVGGVEREQSRLKFGERDFGVIGAGAFAEACHVPGLQSHPQAEVVAICGRHRERAQALAGRFGIPAVHTDPAELIARDDLDGVTLCTPNAVHREQALLAFAHGKHVFCEKPLGLSVAEAEEMARAAEASGRVHQVAFTYRYLHGVEELRRRVQAGDVGEPFLFRAHHEYWDGLRPGAPVGWRELRGPSGGGVGHVLGLGHGEPQRLFAEDVLAVGEGEESLLAVRGVGGADGDAVEVLPGAELARLGVDRRDPEAPGERPRPFRPAAAEGHHLGLRVAEQPWHVAGLGEGSGPDHAETQPGLLDHGGMIS